MNGEGGVTILLRAAGSSQAAHTECGCCGSRFVPKRVRMALRLGDVFHAEICGECVLKGPSGAAEVLRERIRGREARAPGMLARGEAGAVRTYCGWMERRAAALERTRAFPLPARQAAVRELREKR